MKRDLHQPGLWKRLGPTKWLFALALASPTVTGILMITGAPWLGPWLRDDPLGPAIYIAAFILLGGLCILPTYTQCAIAGFAFGFPAGLLAAVVGFLGASIVARRLARSAGGDRVMEIIDEHPRIRAIRDALVGDRELALVDAARPHCRVRAFWRTTLLVALVRLMPQAPFAITNLLMSFLRVPRGPFLLGTLVGLLPRAALFVLIGSTLQELSRDSIDHAVPPWVKLAGLAVTFALVFTVGAIARHAVLRAGSAARAAADSQQAAA
ncbi:MAG: TVP38/TMEM64 family protein [Phycisphaerales bacterium]